MYFLGLEVGHREHLLQLGVLGVDHAGYLSGQALHLGLNVGSLQTDLHLEDMLVDLLPRVLAAENSNQFLIVLAVLLQSVAQGEGVISSPDHVLAPSLADLVLLFPMALLRQGSCCSSVLNSNWRLNSL